MQFPNSEAWNVLFNLNGIEFNLGESGMADMKLGEIIEPESLGSFSLGYGTTRGDEQLREHIANWSSGWWSGAIQKDHVLLTDGAGQALSLLFTSLISRGDHVVVAIPCYTPLVDVLKALKADLSFYVLQREQGFNVCVDDLMTLCTKRTKMVVLCSPMNPTGVRISNEAIESTIKQLGEKNKDAILVVDESFKEAVYSGNSGVCASVFSPSVVTVSSLSKAFGAAGLRIGWLITRNKAIYDALRLAKANTTLCCSSLSELIALQLVQKRKTIMQQRQMQLRTALEVVKVWIRQNDAFVDWIEPGAGAFCMFTLKPCFNDEKVARFLPM